MADRDADGSIHVGDDVPTLEQRAMYGPLWFSDENRTTLYWAGIASGVFFGAIDGALCAHGEGAVLPIGGMATVGMAAAGACGFDTERQLSRQRYGEHLSVQYMIRNRPLDSLGSALAPMILPAAAYWASRILSYSVVKLKT